MRSRRCPAIKFWSLCVSPMKKTDPKYGSPPFHGHKSKQRGGRGTERFVLCRVSLVCNCTRRKGAFLSMIPVRMETDVLVLGGGSAGLCSAMAAREAGASVMRGEWRHPWSQPSGSHSPDGKSGVWSDRRDSSCRGEQGGTARRDNQLVGSRPLCSGGRAGPHDGGFSQSGKTESPAYSVDLRRRASKQ